MSKAKSKATPNKNPPSELGDDLGSAQKLTDKEKLFVEHYLQCRNATEATRRANYQGNDNVLAVTGHRLLRKPKIAELISKRTAEVAADADEVLASLARVHRATLRPFFATADDGTLWPDLGSEEALANFDLLKKIKTKKREGGPPEDRWTEIEVELEIHDPLRAKELLGRHHKLFTDKTEVSGKDGGPIETRDVADTERLERLLALAHAARARGGGNASPGAGGDGEG